MQKTKHGQNMRDFCASYLWTSRSPLLFVICHVNPLFGSKPGWEISRPCFFTSFMYLYKDNQDDYKQIKWNVGNCTFSNGNKKNRKSHVQVYKNLLFCIKMFDPKVFIPNEYIIISGYNIRVQKPLCIPPNIFPDAKRVDSHTHHQNILYHKELKRGW